MHSEQGESKMSGTGGVGKESTILRDLLRELHPNLRRKEIKSEKNLSSSDGGIGQGRGGQ